MPSSLQSFLAEATRKAAADLEAALMRLPEDKRNWSPAEGKARTALDMVAECALVTGDTATLIETRTWNTDYNMEEYERRKASLIDDWPAMKAMLQENVEKVIAVITDVPESDLGVEVAMPWGSMTLAQIMAYPYWNMSYHEGQTNYIASILGCLNQ